MPTTSKPTEAKARHPAGWADVSSLPISNFKLYFAFKTRHPAHPVGVLERSPNLEATSAMQTFPSILATASASDELPEVWWQFAFAAFIIGCLLALAVLVRSLVTCRRSTWFIPATFASMTFGSAALLFAAHVYRIDYQAVEIDGTKASPPFLQALAVPSLPIIASLAALAVYQRRLALI